MEKLANLPVLRSGDTRLAKIDPFSQALRDGRRLHVWRSGSGLRIAQLVNPSDTSENCIAFGGVGCHVEEALLNLVADYFKRRNPLLSLRARIRTRRIKGYLRDLSVPSNKVDRWVARGGDINACAVNDHVHVQFTGTRQWRNEVPRPVMRFLTRHGVEFEWRTPDRPGFSYPSISNFKADGGRVLRFPLCPGDEVEWKWWNTCFRTRVGELARRDYSDWEPRLITQPTQPLGPSSRSTHDSWQWYAKKKYYGGVDPFLLMGPSHTVTGFYCVRKVGEAPTFLEAFVRAWGAEEQWLESTGWAEGRDVGPAVVIGTPARKLPQKC